MREIKYCGLSKNGWVYGLPFYSPGTGTWKIVHSNGWVPTYSNPDEGESNVFVDVDPKTIGQYTGLKDKNGKEIYEGDVVKILYTDWMSKSENDTRTIEQYMYDIAATGVIEFKNCEFGVKICSDLLDSIHCGRHGFIQVIGNIHENPELIKNINQESI